MSLNPDLKEMSGEGAAHGKRGLGISSSKRQGPDPRNNLACSRKSKSDRLEPSEQGRENELHMRQTGLHNWQVPVQHENAGPLFKTGEF